MQRRRNIRIAKATEEELIRYQMENIISTSKNEIEGLGECSEALAKMYILIKERHARLFFRFLAGCYFFIGLLVLTEKFFRRKA